MKATKINKYLSSKIWRVPLIWFAIADIKKFWSEVIKKCPLFFKKNQSDVWNQGNRYRCNPDK